MVPFVIDDGRGAESGGRGTDEERGSEAGGPYWRQTRDRLAATVVFFVAVGRGNAVSVLTEVISTVDRPQPSVSPAARARRHCHLRGW